MPDLMNRFDCFTAIFGAHYAKQFGQAGYRELLQASAVEDHPLVADMAPAQRARLRAVLRLSELWYPEQEQSPSSLTSVGDVVRLIHPRTRTLADRVVWLLVLDASDGLTDEVLVQMGGEPLAPPPVRTLLRHALFKGAVSAWVVDFRQVEALDVPADTSNAFMALREAGLTIGIIFHDWVLFSGGGIRSVSQATSAIEVHRSTLSEAA